MKKNLILKVQRPLYASDPHIADLWLFYDKTKRKLNIQAQPDADAIRVMGKDVKCYVLATVDKAKGRIDIIRRVKDRKW